MTIAVVVLLPVTIGLGVWQLQRAAEKRGYEQLFVERMSARPVPAPADLGEGEAAAFLRLRLVGEFDSGRYFLLDNQLDAGRPGYWVIASFHADDGRRWLVNRGWIAAPPQRELLPAVPEQAGRVEIVGAVWPDSGLGPLLAEDPWQGPWPLRVQRLNVTRMARRLENAVPREIRLEAGQPGVLKAPSLRTRFDAQRHTGYALQWFGLAAALVAGYTIFGNRR